MGSETAWPYGWGEYRPYIEQVLDMCADYLSRLQRSLGGEITPDRFYFVSKADALHEAVTSLLERCEEVESWIEEEGQRD